MSGPHPSHRTRFSDASTFDFICELCGETDAVPGGWAGLARPCSAAEATRAEYDAARAAHRIPPRDPSTLRGG